MVTTEALGALLRPAPPDVLPAKERRVMGVPRHVLIIPDNNRTWAKFWGKSIREGYNEGAKRIVEVGSAAANIDGLDFLTVHLASRDNIVKRPPGELTDLWDAVKEKMIDNGIPALIDQGVRVRVIGNLEGVRDDIKEGFADLSERSKENTGLALTFVLGYDSKQEMREAMSAAQYELDHSGNMLRRITRRVLSRRKVLTPEDIERHKYLQEAGLPGTVDGVMRTGERRTSGIFPEPIAQAEYAFLEDLTWPEFGADKFEYTIADLASRAQKGGG